MKNRAVAAEDVAVAAVSNLSWLKIKLVICSSMA
jgi:hypothetical protein